MTTREIMQRKKKCTVILENGSMLEKMARWNACLTWPTHKTASLRETCNNHFPYWLCLVQLAIILHLFWSIRVSLKSCRSVCGTLVLLFHCTLNQIFPSILLTTRNYLLSGWHFPLKPNIWMSAEKKILTRCFSLNEARGRIEMPWNKSLTPLKDCSFTS